MAMTAGSIIKDLDVIEDTAHANLRKSPELHDCAVVLVADRFQDFRNGNAIVPMHLGDRGFLLFIHRIIF